ncbi:MAG: beta-glucosidase [Candidatus Dormibacteria bacterium]
MKAVVGTALATVAFGASALFPRALTMVLATGPCGDVAQRPWCDISLTPDQRAGLLIKAMTPAERVKLLGGDTVTGGPVGQSHTGASFAIPRVGIPAIYYSDGPVGPRQGAATAMPIPMALAAGFDPAAAYRYATVVANETRAKGNSVVFGPTVNIMRNPQGGRTYEAFGEDPYVMTRTTVPWIEGAQAQGVMADVKHFAANNQEGLGGIPPVLSLIGGRQFSNDVIDERTLREIYLPQFEAAVREAHVATVMCSYNKINGPYNCENQHLLTDILKKEWAFPGYVLSDYAATHSTAGSITNGLDFEPWPSDWYSENALNAALTAGQITQAQVDSHVLRILRTMFQFGVFDRAPYPNDDSRIDKPGHAAVARGIEESAITLLKNQAGTLPLNPANLHRVAVIGPYANRFVTGGGSGQVTAFAAVTALDGIKARLGPSVMVTYDDGSNVSAATADAAAADRVIVVVGDVDTEGQDRGCLDLNCPLDAENALAFACSSACPPNGTNEDGLISSVAAANPRTTVVLETSGPVLTPWRDQVPAIVEAWYPGEQGGTAIARVLFGDVNPSGRLPATFPKLATDTPTGNDLSRYPGLDENVAYTEGVFVGYRWYDANNIEPAFTFGSGLSYTSFGYSGLRIQPSTVSGAVATVSLTVTNTGARPGSVIPQLYLHLPSPSPGVPQPPKQLRGYSRVNLAPGRQATVSFPLDERAFSYWDVVSHSWKVTPGCYAVLAGDSSRQLPLSGTISRDSTACGPGAVAIGPLTTATIRRVLPNTGTTGLAARALLVAVAGMVVAAVTLLGLRRRVRVRYAGRAWPLPGAEGYERRRRTGPPPPRSSSRTAGRWRAASARGKTGTKPPRSGGSAG